MPDYLIRPKSVVDANANDASGAVLALGRTDPATVTGLSNGTAYYAQEVLLSPLSAAFTPALPPAGPDWVRFDSSDWLDMGAATTSADGFTFAAKIRAASPYAFFNIGSNGFDSRMLIEGNGNITFRAEDTAGAAVATGNAVAGAMTAGDELAIALACSKTAATARYAINGGVPVTVSLTTALPTANDIDVPEFINSVNAGGTGGQVSTADIAAIWLATGYVDVVANWSAFFDGSNDPTPAMTSGGAIQSVAAAFAQAGDAASWNALGGMTGAVADA